MSHLEPTEEEYEREGGLPVWSRRVIDALRASARQSGLEVARLRDVVAQLEAQITEAAEANTGPEDSTAWLWRETGGEELPPLGLGKDARVTFHPADGIEISAQAEGNGITVESYLHLMVIPIERTRFLIQPVSAKIRN